MRYAIGTDPAGNRLIDSAETLGLEGTENSLAYRVEEIEKHLHNREKWFGLASIPSTELHVADRMGPGILPFIITSGNDAYGAWVQILGSEDTPVNPAMEKYDAHRFIVTQVTATQMFNIQVIAGETVDFAARLADEEYTEAPFIALSNNNDSGISDIMTSRVPSGTKAWARCICIGQDAKTVSLYHGVHEYSG